MAAIKWTVQQDEWLRDLYPDNSNRVIALMLERSSSAIQNRAIIKGMRKSAEYMDTKPGSFDKGLTPWNKGISWDSGGRSAETRFKSGQTPTNWKPVGTEVIDTYGYRRRKIKDDAPKGRSYRNWRFVHILVWEKHHGRELPKGHIVRFKDGDIDNLDPDNLVAVTRAENAVINRWIAMGPLPEGGMYVVITMARVMMAARKRKEEVA